MRKTFLKVSLFSLLTVGMATSFTACKDYDDDIDNLQTQIDAMQKDLAEIKDMVSKGAVITSVTQGENGVTITLSNGNTYNITNGKDGQNGKDADVWTIVKNAEGAYVWAKNGEATEFPAQGPAGEAGAAGATGNYFKPNAETGKFDEYKADGTLVGATNIEWRATVEQTLTAVDNGNTVTFYGLVDKDGNELEPQVLAKTGTLSGLTLVPDLYVNGIETMRTEDASGNILTTGTAAVSASAPLTTGGVGVANVAKGEITSFVNKVVSNKIPQYDLNSINFAKYILNPNNANIDGISWSFLTNDATIESRASKAVLNVASTQKDEEGNLVVAYTVADNAALAPNKDAANKKTIAALQATLTDNSVVSSDFVAVESRNIAFTAIRYAQAGVPTVAAPGFVAQPAVKTTLEQAISYSLQVPYDATFNLADHIAVSYTNGVYTLAELASKYGLTMSYSILPYTQGANATAENMYGAVNATTGVFTPMYVNAAGQSVSAVGAAGGRSAIDRQPVVVLQLTDAEGNIILGGFIKLLIVELATSNEPINAGTVTVPYLCKNFESSISWDVIAGQLVESTGMTVLQFQQNYTFEGNYVDVDGKLVKMTAGSVPSNQQGAVSVGDLGSFKWNSVQGGSQTNVLTLTVTPAQVQNYYPTFNDNGSFKAYNMTTTPVTKTLYAGFWNKTTNHYVYIGYTVTVVGKPTVTYSGQLESQWAQNYTVAPLNPAVAANANQTIPAVASKMTFTMSSLWNGGNPKYSAEAPFNFTDNTSAAGKLTYAGPFQTTYTFAATQPTIEGASGDKYGFVVANNGQTLQAYYIDPDKTINDAYIAAADKQTVATINNGVFLIEASYGDYVRDIVNAEAFDLNNPATLFNVDMNLFYGSCSIPVNKVGNFKVGVGRPIDVVNPNEIIEITDASGDYTRVLGTLANVVDWQGYNLWNAVYDVQKDENGNVISSKLTGFKANETVNGVNLWNFWMGTYNGGLNGTITFGKTGNNVILTNSTNSLVGATPLTTREGFDIKFQVGNQKGLSEINVSKAADLFGAQFVYENNSGNSVVAPFYVFIPVVAHYTWGDSNIGYATVKILPTQTSIN